LTVRGSPYSTIILYIQTDPKTINRWLAEAGVMMTQGTLVDATIIEAPSSTRNKQQRDPEMHQTKKGNQWHFGMKAHIGVDAVA
jgi:IS5 family transposase